MRLHLEDGERVRLRASLGLPEDASEATVAAAVQARLFADSTGNGNGDTGVDASGSGSGSEEGTGGAGNGSVEPSVTASGSQGSGGTSDDDGGGSGHSPEVVFTDDDDIVPLDRESFNRLVGRANDADQLREDARVDRRNGIVEAAIRDGKIPPSRRDHYRTRYDDDPDGVSARIGAMPKNVIPVHERGVDASDEEVSAADSYPKEWLPEQARREATTSAAGATGGSRQSLSTRVQSEE